MPKQRQQMVLLGAGASLPRGLAGTHTKISGVLLQNGAPTQKFALFNGLNIHSKRGFRV